MSTTPAAVLGGRAARFSPLSDRFKERAAKLALSVGALAAIGASTCSAAQVNLTGAHLTQLLFPGAYAIVGNERFDNFSFTVTASGGASTPNPANIAVSAINTPDYGLNFAPDAPAGQFSVNGTQKIGGTLNFDVSLTDASLLNGAALSFVANTTVGGYSNLSETIRDNGNAQLAQNSVSRGSSLPSGGNNSDSHTFAPQLLIHVKKDIFLQGDLFGPPGVGTASLTSFTQTFSQVGNPVPEANSGILAAVGAMSIGLFCAFKRRLAQPAVAK